MAVLMGPEPGGSRGESWGSGTAKQIEEDQRQQERSKGYVAHETCITLDSWGHLTPLLTPVQAPSRPSSLRKAQGDDVEEAVHHRLPGHPGHTALGVALLFIVRKKRKENAEAAPR